MIKLIDISLFSILLPSGMVFFTWKHLSRSLRIIAIFILFTLLLETASKYHHIEGKNNMYLFHLFTSTEMIFLTFYFRSLFQGNLVKRMLEVLLIGFLAFSVWNVYNNEPLHVFPSRQRYTECILIILVSMYFFIQLFQRSQVTNLTTYPHYWLVSGFLLYFAGTFFLNIVGDIAINTNKLGFFAYDIHSVLNIFLNITYTLALWLNRRTSTSGQ